MAKYTPRLTAPSTTDKNWLHYSKGGHNYCMVISNGSCIPNCVGYAWGRWREILGKYHNLSRANAEVWWGNTSDGYKRGQTPKVGAVMCWRKGVAGNESDGAGHVAIVEKINADGSVTYSNSAYKGSRFYTNTIKSPYRIGSAYTFQGFIYLPTEFEEEKKETATNTNTNTNTNSFFPTRGYFKKGDVSANVGKIATFMRKTFPAYTNEKALGNTYGDNLIAAVKEFQRRTGLTPDGLFGKLTLAKLETYGFKK